MATQSQYTNINGAFFQNGANGLMAVSDPNILNGLKAGTIQSGSQSLGQSTGTFANPNNPSGSNTGPSSYNQSTSIISNPNTPTSLQSTPVNPTPPASSLGYTKSINMPAQQTPTASTASAGVIGTAAGTNSALQLQQQQIAIQQQQDNEARAQVQGNQGQVTDLLQRLSGKGQAQLDAENAAGIPQMQLDTAQKTADANSLTNQYQTMQLAYNQQYQEIASNPNITTEQRNQQIQSLTQQHAYGLTDVAIKQSIFATEANNSANLTATQQALVNHKIDIQYGTLKDLIGYQTQILASNQAILSQKDQDLLNSKIAYNTQQYTEGVYQAHLFESTKIQQMQLAQSQGAPASVLDSISSADNYGDMLSAGAGYNTQGSYSVQQVGISPDTGLPIYAKVNSTNGVATPLTLSGATSTGTSGGSQSTIVNGYQFGKSDTLGAYASDTYTQVGNIQSAVSKIQTNVGSVTTAEQADKAIQTVLAKGVTSPITGEMVMAAAQKYGVDPATIIGVMQAETQCGTDGSKGAKQCNWGNVGNTDSLMKSGGSIAMTPQLGVEAVARNLAMRDTNRNAKMKTAEQGTVNPQNVTQTGVDFGILKANAPAYISGALGHLTSTGSAFIDGSKISTGLDTVASVYAKNNNIPILNASEVANAKSTDEAIRNIINVIQPAWEKIAPTGIISRGINKATYGASQLFDTNFYTDNNTFATNKENVAQQIRALSQSAPKLGLLATASDALPNNEGLKGNGGVYDTLKDGNAKLQRTLDLLNQSLKTYIPGDKGATLNNGKTNQTAITANQINYQGKIYNVDAQGNMTPQ